MKRSSSSSANDSKQCSINENSSDYSKIQVVVRCRPVNSMEKKANDPVILSCNSITNSVAISSTGLGKRTGKDFNFHRVYGPAVSQQKIYSDVVSPLVDDVILGFNCTVFAYGQTGTGKTYTMQGHNPNSNHQLSLDSGIIPRAIDQLTTKLKRVKFDYALHVSFLEVYQEELHDLLDTRSKHLKIYDGSKQNKSKKSVNKHSDLRASGIYVHNLEEKHVSSPEKIYAILSEGTKRRATSPTEMNKDSSRSHAIFTITVHIKESGDTPGDDVIRIGKLRLVDLAGSESASRSGATGERQREAGSINKSLLTLGRVINALVNGTGHVPYRESKITRLLSDSIGGATKTCLISTISPCKRSLEETLSTLQYASQASNVKNNPQANLKISKFELLQDYTSTIQNLKSQLEAARQQEGVFLPLDQFQEMEMKASSAENSIKELQMEIDQKQQIVKELTDNLFITESELEKISLDLQETQKETAQLSNLTNNMHAESTQILSSLEDRTNQIYRLHNKIDRFHVVEAENSKLVKQYDSKIKMLKSKANITLNNSLEAQSQCFSTTVNDIGALIKLSCSSMTEVSKIVNFLGTRFGSFASDLTAKIDSLKKSSIKQSKNLGDSFSVLDKNIKECLENHQSEISNSLFGLGQWLEKREAAIAEQLNSIVSTNLKHSEESQKWIQTQQKEYLNLIETTFSQYVNNQTQQLKIIADSVSENQQANNIALQSIKSQLLDQISTLIDTQIESEMKRQKQTDSANVKQWQKNTQHMQKTVQSSFDTKAKLLNSQMDEYIVEQKKTSNTFQKEMAGVDIDLVINPHTPNIGAQYIGKIASSCETITKSTKDILETNQSNMLKSTRQAFETQIGSFQNETSSLVNSFEKNVAEQGEQATKSLIETMDKLGVEANSILLTQHKAFLSHSSTITNLWSQLETQAFSAFDFIANKEWNTIDISGKTPQKTQFVIPSLKYLPKNGAPLESGSPQQISEKSHGDSSELLSFNPQPSSTPIIKKSSITPSQELNESPPLSNHSSSDETEEIHSCTVSVKPVKQKSKNHFNGSVKVSSKRRGRTPLKSINLVEKSQESLNQMDSKSLKKSDSIRSSHPTQSSSSTSSINRLHQRSSSKLKKQKSKKTNSNTSPKSSTSSLRSKRSSRRNFG